MDPITTQITDTTRLALDAREIHETTTTDGLSHMEAIIRLRSNLVNGHALEVKGLGALDILGSPSVQEICHALERLRESADPGPDNSITL